MLKIAYLILGIILGFILSLAVTVKAAEVTVPMAVTCANGDYKEMKNHFYQYFSENIILSGVITGGKVMLYILVDKSTGKWSVVTAVRNDVYCLIFHGDGLTPGHSSKVQYNGQSY